MKLLFVRNLPATGFALIVVLLPLVTGCRTIGPRSVDLTPSETNQIYRVEVSDSDEAQLLKQQLSITPIEMEGPYLMFSASEGILGRLAEFGYVAQPVDQKSISHRVVKILRKGSEEDLLKHGVTLLLREKKHWIVRGSLAQLESVRAGKY